ncbi:MAG: NAD(P)H-dependent oxidoreductase subunit E [Candidatus Margulisbacteria bacterium]|nr:NAD(P)H-dependent oxidoreductase subunit E [Candidatus Margulisiibacteriota bacterium]MBU1617818.1 NAD(P)H-dependent oxidoreductase subunit E [Candidatus Margulisiibacteriota bacterium]
MKKEVSTGNIEKIIEKWKGKKGSLIMALHELQHLYGYIPQKGAEKMSTALRIPLSQIYEVITFYNLFKLKEPGKNTIAVCMGTACYLKGAPELLNELKVLLKVEEGGTTKDGLFNLDVVRCLGCCGLAPVMTINGEIFGKLKKGEIKDILAKYKKKEQK